MTDLLGADAIKYYFCSMQKIPAYITELLVRHDCVIIPEFGGFVSTYKPACYNAEASKFLPPSKAVSFNRNLTHNDGLLSQQIMKHEQKSFAEAGQAIQLFVDSLEVKLQSESFQFEGLGTLQRNDNGALIFEPDAHNKLLSAAYGLSGFHFKQLAQDQKSGNLRLVKTETRKRNIKQKVYVPFAAAAAAIILIFFLFFPLDVNDTRLSEANFISAFDSLEKSQAADRVSEDNLDETKANLSQKATIENAQTETLAPASEILEPEPVSEAFQQKMDTIKHDIKVVPSVVYHIIVASMSSKAQAIKFVEQNCKGNYPNATIIESNGRYRVSIHKFTRKKVAIPVLETFRENNPKFKDAWLLTIKPTV